jgi:hypothetical protein
MAAIDEMGNFAADDGTGAHGHAQASCVLCFFEDDGGAVFTDALLICDSADGFHIELEAAKFAENVVPRALARFLEHGCDFPGKWPATTLNRSGDRPI